MHEKRPIKVQQVKLGRQGAYGTADTDLNQIQMDPRLVGKKKLEVLIHEILHIQNPDWSETRVLKMSKQLTKMLWLHNYRQVDNQVRQTAY